MPLLALLALLLPLLPTAAPAQPVESSRPRHTIDLVLFRGCEDACRGFIDWFANRNIPVDIRQHDAGQSMDRLAEIVAGIRASPPDLVVTWGTRTAQAVFGQADAVDPAVHVVGVPGIFMVVSQPVASGLVRDVRAPGRPLTGSLYLSDVREQLDTATAYVGSRRTTPWDSTDGITHVGTLYNPAEPNAVINIDQLRAETARRGLQLTALPLPLDESGAPYASAIPRLMADLASSGADLVYQPADTFLNVNRHALTAAALSQRMPVLAAGEAPVRSGHALLGLVYRYHDVGRLTARLAHRVLEGADPATIPIVAPPQPALIVNQVTAEDLNLPPSPAMARFIEFVRP
ncbi:ABC transporter substrate-binding protein [Caenispirillum bisanense]|uniref:ABC transporter substrate-binding protein n=1 Tax=Caenispirillum bisanense TaxID=414052 RepID=UPI0031CF8E78